MFGLEANLADFIKLSGDIGFVYTQNAVVAIGREVNAFMGVEGAAYVEVQNANFGAKWTQQGFAFETYGGSLAADILGMAGVRADQIAVYYGEGLNIARGSTLAAGALTYTWQQRYASTVTTRGFEAKGFEANFFSLLKASGDISFVMGVSGIQAEGESFNLSFELGDAVRIAMVDTDFRFGYFEPGFQIMMDGTIELDLFDFVDVSFDVSFNQVFETRKLTDGTEVALATFSFAKSNLDFNVGTDDVGFGIEDADFGLTLNLAIDGSFRWWIGAKATADTVYFRGSDILEVSADELEVLVNTGSESAGGVAIDWSDEPLTLVEGFGIILPGVEVGSDTLSDVTLDMDADIIAVRGFLTLNIFGLLRVDGLFSFQQRVEDILLTDGNWVTTTAMSFAAVGTNARLGIGEGDDFIGFQMLGVDFGLMIADEFGGDRQWTAVRGLADEISFAGIPGLVLEATNVDLNYLKGAADETQINVDIFDVNFAGLPVEMSLGMSAFGIDMSDFQVSLADVMGGLGQNLETMSLEDVLFQLANVDIAGFDVTLPTTPRAEWPALNWRDADVDWRSLSLAEFLKAVPSLGLPDYEFTYEVQTPTDG